MQITHRRLPGKSWPQYVIATGDWHLGTPNCHRAGIEKCLEDCKHHLWVNHGDIAECIMPSDNRYSVEEHQDTVLASCGTAAELCGMAAQTCIGLIDGNHDGKISKRMGGVTKHIGQLAKVPYLGETQYVHLEGAKKVVTWFIAHGRLTFLSRQGDVERRETQRQITLRGYLGHFVADIAGVGHGHFGIVSPPVYRQRMSPDMKRRPFMVKEGWCYMTPAFLKNYGDHPGYAEAALLPSTDLGWVRIYIDRDGAIPIVHLINENGKVVSESCPKVIA